MNLGSFGLWKLTTELIRFVKIFLMAAAHYVCNRNHTLNLLILIESL